MKKEGMNNGRFVKQSKEGLQKGLEMFDWILENEM